MQVVARVTQSWDSSTGGSSVNRRAGCNRNSSFGGLEAALAVAASADEMIDSGVNGLGRWVRVQKSFKSAAMKKKQKEEAASESSGG